MVNPKSLLEIAKCSSEQAKTNALVNAAATYNAECREEEKTEREKAFVVLLDIRRRIDELIGEPKLF